MSQLSDRPLWEQISVQQFLGSVNWDDIAQKPSLRSNTILDFDDASGFQRPDPNAPLPLSLTIAQFMTAVNWDGVAMMEVSTTPDLVNRTDDRESTLTLSDFSDMF